jgi:hypothetical protein
LTEELPGETSEPAADSPAAKQRTSTVMLPERHGVEGVDSNVMCDFLFAIVSYLD